MDGVVKIRKKRWYDAYLPFIAQPAELQVHWLVNACCKKKLSAEELTPYLRLLLSVDNVETDEELREVLQGIEGETVDCFLKVVEIYDLPRLLMTLPDISTSLALLALRKEIPSYEKNVQKLVDKVFYALNNRAEHIFRDITLLADKGDMADHFRDSIARFKKILADEAFLRSMYPHAT